MKELKEQYETLIKVQQERLQVLEDTITFMKMNLETKDATIEILQENINLLKSN